MDVGQILKSAIIGLILVAVSFYLGIGAATEQQMTMLKFVLVAGFAACLMMGTRIWLIVPFATYTNVIIMRGFSLFELAQMAFIAFAVLLFLMRKLPLQFRFHELDRWLLLMLFLLGQSYARNPVGINMFGAEMVGGKPYALLGLALICSVLLANLKVKPQEIKWAMYATIAGGLSSLFLNKFRWGAFGGGGGGGGGGETTAPGAYEYGQGRATRNGTFSVYSNTIAQWVSSKISPLKSFLHPLWGGLMLASLALAMGSGYRNSVASVGLYYLFAIIYRGGIFSLLASCTLGVAGLVAISLVNLVSPLPPNVQRTLTIFPGTWEQQYKEDAKGSTDWRVTMWKEALFTEKYIDNKIIGDGLGFSVQKLKQMEAASERDKGGVDATGLDAHQQNVMISGDFHSGPVQTIRAIGYVGLLALWFVMFRLAVHAHRQIMRCKGTEYFSLALFFGIPLLAYPIFWTFIFGDFEMGYKTVFFGMAMMKMLEYNLPLPMRQRSAHWIPLSTRGLPPRPEPRSIPSPARSQV